MQLNKESRSVRVGESDILLSELEFALLDCLAGGEGRVLSRKEIAERLWKDGGTETNRIDVYINYLRKKIELPFGRRCIFTKRGEGYYLKI